MIVWRGWGILAVLIAAIGLFGGVFVGVKLLGSGSGWDGGRIGIAIGLAIAAVANWFVGKSVNDNLRLQGVTAIKRHTLFFIPMQWWSIAMVMGSIFYLQAAIQR